MFMRFRWFLLGVASSMGVVAYLAAQVKRAREKLTAQSMIRGSGKAVATLFDRAASKISPDNDRPV